MPKNTPMSAPASPFGTVDAHAGRRRNVGMAWLALCLALAVHVADEALNGFLAVYNSTVMAIRHTLAWLPLPVFTFEAWLAGLIVVTIALSVLSVFAFRGARWIRPAGYVLAAIMLVNALGHTLATAFGRTVASVPFSGPMPGFYSSPLLAAAAVHLLLRLRSAASAEARSRPLPR